MFFCYTASAFGGQTTKPYLRPKIQSIVDKLGREKTLHLGLPVGFSAKPETRNKYYKLYKKLSSKATNEELSLLTDDINKTIVLYSYNILSSRGYSELKQIFLNHLNDTTEVWLAAGCTGSVDKVNLFMLGSLNPIYYPAHKAYLTKDEYDNYLAIINKP